MLLSLAWLYCTIREPFILQIDISRNTKMAQRLVFLTYGAAQMQLDTRTRSLASQKKRSD